MKPRLILAPVLNEKAGNINHLVIEVTPRVIELWHTMRLHMQTFRRLDPELQSARPAMRINFPGNLMAFKQLPPMLEEFESLSCDAVLLPEDMELSDIEMDCTNHESSEDSYDPDYERRTEGEALEVDWEGDAIVYLRENDSEEDDCFCQDLEVVFRQIENAPPVPDELKTIEEYYDPHLPRLGNSGREIYQGFIKACGEHISGTEVVAYDPGSHPILYFAHLHGKLVITETGTGHAHPDNYVPPTYRGATSREADAFHDSLSRGHLVVARHSRPGVISSFAKTLHEQGQVPFDLVIDKAIDEGKPVNLDSATRLGVQIPTTWVRDGGILRPPTPHDTV